MSESEFWKSTPREMKALLDVHIEINNPKPPKKFIDKVL